MKKLLLLLFLLALSSAAFADQLAWLTKEQADKTEKWLKAHPIRQAILWCACCDNDPKQKITIQKYEIRQVEGQSEYWELVLTGKNSAGEQISVPVDLAYVHINVKGKAKCLGREIGLECDPCTKPFPWAARKK